jgi:SAM-dependent methyltransferase
VRTRRQPRRSQFDYLHQRALVDDLTYVLGRLNLTSPEVLDVFCGTRPYEDLLPPGSRCTGLDVTAKYGMADIVTSKFLPCADQAFDLILCTQAFHYVMDPAAGLEEFRRVLRPGGWCLVTVPSVWEYDRRGLERRYTGPELASLFTSWNEVEVREQGGRGTLWSTLSCQMLTLGQSKLPSRIVREALTPLLRTTYLLVNLIGASVDRIERASVPRYSLPVNLRVVARRPPGD